MTDTATTIDLEDPIKRGDQVIDRLQLRKPASGELRGLDMADLIKMNVVAVQTLLPRITIPPITAVEAKALSPADLFACGIEVAGFLLPKGMRPDFPA